MQYIALIAALMIILFLICLIVTIRNRRQPNYHSVDMSLDILQPSEHTAEPPADHRSYINRHLHRNDARDQRRYNTRQYF